MHDSGGRAVGLVKRVNFICRLKGSLHSQSVKANKTTRARQRPGQTSYDLNTGETCTLEIRLER